MGNSPATTRTNVKLLALLLFVSLPMTFPFFPPLATFSPCSCSSFPQSVLSGSLPRLCFLHLSPRLSCLVSVSVDGGEDESCSPSCSSTPSSPGRWDAPPAPACPEPGKHYQGCWLGMPPFQLWMLLVASAAVKKARSGADAVCLLHFCSESRQQHNCWICVQAQSLWGKYVKSCFYRNQW